MMKMSECIEILERNTPSYFKHNSWMTNHSQILVQSLHLDGILASIDISEIKDKTDEEVKKLVNDRIIGALSQVVLQIDPDYFVNKEQETMKELTDIKQCADGGTELVSNQGQGLDGYSELANYRSVIERFMKDQS
jgi:hypothetical protein